MEDELELDVSDLQDKFLSAEESTQKARELSERDRDYYDNKQLTPKEVETLRKRGQPPIVINRIKRKIDFLEGLEKQQRTDPKAYPRNPNDEESAEVATDALRYVADNVHLDVQRSRLWKDSLIEGIGISQVTIRQTFQGTQEINVERVAFDRFFYDPHSEKPDFSDARFMGLVIWQDIEEVIAKYGDEFRDQVSALVSEEGRMDTYDDKPKHHLWSDGKRKRVRVVQIWIETDDGWAFCEFTGAVKYAFGISPYLDEEGRPEHPFECISSYIDRDNNRYGVVREMIDPQDEINKRRSKALHLLNTRQVIADKGAVDDITEARRELAKPDGYIEKNVGFVFEVAQTTDMAIGQTQLLQEAKNEIDLMGPNPALSGKQGGDQSGRAIQAQQQGGLMELGGLLDNLRQWDRQVYRKMWRRIKQSWTEAKWIRVTDDQNVAQFVGINQPQFDQFGQQVAIENPIAQMDVDIIIEDAPDVVTLQGEQFDTFMQILPTLAQLPPKFAQMAVEMAPNLRNKDRIMEILGVSEDPEQQAQQQAQDQAQKQIEMQQLNQQFEETEADIANTQADTENKRANAIKSATQAAEIAANQGTIQ